MQVGGSRPCVPSYRRILGNLARNTRSRRRRRRALHFEAMEERVLLATTAGIVVGTLVVDGDGGDEVIDLRLSADGLQLEVDDGGDGTAEHRFALTAFDEVSVSGNGGDDAVSIDVSNGDFTLAKATTLQGGAGSDTLIGAGGDESLFGDAGDDVLAGRAGDDTLDGGSGADTLRGQGGHDVLLGRAGGDALDGGTWSDTVFGHGGDDTLWGKSGDDRLLGGDDNDLFVGFNPGDDTVDGGAGRDRLELRGTDQDDVYHVDWNAKAGKLFSERRLGDGTLAESDVAREIEEFSILTLDGRDEVDLSQLDQADLAAAGLTGISVNAGKDGDTILASGGSDTLLGGEGDDVVAISGTSFATIDGASGTDTLRFDGAGITLDLPSTRDDRITGIEQIDLTGSGLNFLNLGVQAVLNLSAEFNTLTILGDDDRVDRGPDWDYQGPRAIDGTRFYFLAGGAATLYVSTSVFVTAPPAFELSDLLPENGGDGSAGFVLNGIDPSDISGWVVSDAGDVNGDDFDDLLIGADGGDPGGRVRAGESYVVFGQADGFGPVLELASLDGTNGFVINGVDVDDQSGESVSKAGDVNGDGFDDLIIGAHRSDPGGRTNAGTSYVILGKPGPFDAVFDLSLLDGTNGFAMHGIGSDERAAFSVRNAGDVNGDGFGDLLVGAPWADPVGPGYGASYVVFGKQAGFQAELELSSLDGTNGFAVHGNDPFDGFGRSVSTAGDVNGDGLDDFVIAAPTADPNGLSNAGQIYVVFGNSDIQSPVVDVASLDGANGFVVNGVDTDDRFGQWVSTAGDINGDGFDDLLIGAQLGPPDNHVGATYVVFGKAAGFGAVLEAASLDGTNGFTLKGFLYDQHVGKSVSGAGDVNGDGLDDLLIGAWFASDPVRGDYAGAAYVIYGSHDGFEAESDISSLLDGTNGFPIHGIERFDFTGWSVSGAGDFDGDGFDDLLIGAWEADPGDAGNAGRSYVVFGGDRTDSVTHTGSSGAEFLVGDAGANTMIGGTGADTMVGGGGADVLRGGEGDDVLAVGDAGFARIVGGNGGDTLRLDGAGITLDLTAIPDNRILGIERIDIRGSGANTLMLNVLEVLNLSDESNTLIVDTTADDVVDMGSGWSFTGTQSLDGGLFSVYTQGAATLLVGGQFALSSLLPENGGDGGSGFVFQGGGDREFSGWRVSGAGDINGDGFDDVVIGGPSVDAGASYVVFGKSDGFPPVLDPSLLDGTNGFTLSGIDAGDLSGAVSSAGDVNGDGFDDLLIGAPGAEPGTVSNYEGESYVVFGKSESFPAMLNLSSLDGTNGFRMSGIVFGNQIGAWLSSAGDVNGDGFSDLALGSGSPWNYVLFGKSGGFGAVVDLASLDGSNGFQLLSRNSDPNAISGVGDINGDGFDDVMIGRHGADDSYVVFGKRNPFPPGFRLWLLDGVDGFAIKGSTGGGGGWISGAGDINGDGFDDLLVGSQWSVHSGKAGVTYVIYGKPGRFAASLDVAALDGASGFSIQGIDPNDYAGGSVSGAGDVNGDGFDDVIIGASGADPNGKSGAGESYVVYGRPDRFPAELQLGALANSSDGFVVQGVGASEFSGTAVRGAGDVNGDGFDDLIIGATHADRAGKEYAGESYVLFGGDFSAAVTHQGDASDNVLVGDAGANVMIGGTGADTLVGGGGADVLRGGEGDDVLAVAGAASARIVGGNGTDTLRFDGFAMELDLRAVPDNRITGIEQVSMLGSGPNSLALNVLEVLNLSDESNTLSVFGEGDDTVRLTPDWTLSGTEVIGGTLMNVFTQGAAVLKIASVMQTVIITDDLTLDAEHFVNSTRDAPDSNSADGVCDTGDVLNDGTPECTLRAAIMQANARHAQTTVHVPAGTYTLALAGADEHGAVTGDLDIRARVILVGAGSDNTIIDAGALDRIFDVKANLEIHGMTIQNGAAPDGAGIRIIYGSTLLDDVVVTRNHATWHGGGGRGYDTSLLLDTFVAGPRPSVAPMLIATGATISHNSAGLSGGGISAYGALTVADSTISGNTANEDGGGIMHGGGTLTITGSTISGNTANEDGGGIMHWGGTLTITGSTISGNSTVQRRGGGILTDGTALVVDSTISGNTANEDGGGIMHGSGTLTITDSTISGNSAVQRRGGGVITYSTLTITNSTISGNSAHEGGGGIFRGGGAVTITAVTLAGNSSDAGGSGLAGSSFTLLNTILANTGRDCSVSNSTSLGHNLSSDFTCSFFSSALADLRGTDPLLGPLADNGGPTLTHGLLPGSPAIDAGDNAGAPPNDQRGISRPQDGDGDGTAVVDIGAFEFEPSSSNAITTLVASPGAELTQRPSDAPTVRNQPGSGAEVSGDRPASGFTVRAATLGVNSSLALFGVPAVDLSNLLQDSAAASTRGAPAENDAVDRPAGETRLLRAPGRDVELIDELFAEFQSSAWDDMFLQDNPADLFADAPDAW